MIRGHLQNTSARRGEGVKGKRTRADIGGSGGQARVDVHIQKDMVPKKVIKKFLKKVSKKT